ncbi:MAG: response regulator transcription factor [Raineya sp.]
MKRMAIVEDNYKLLQNLIERISKYDDISISFTALNGKEALEKIEKLPVSELPEVILMDIEMDKMNGIEATKQIKSRFAQVKILMLTVFDNDEKVFEAIKAGASGYLLKDEKIEKIYEAIEMLQSGGSLLSPIIARKILDFLGKNSPQVHTPNQETLLSNREMEVLQLVIEGISYYDIAEKLSISYGTVRTHVRNIFEKLHVKNKQEATKIAIEKKWFWQ